jgi:hypothetical protein
MELDQIRRLNDYLSPSFWDNRAYSSLPGAERSRSVDPGASRAPRAPIQQLPEGTAPAEGGRSTTGKKARTREIGGAGREAAMPLSVGGLNHPLKRVLAAYLLREERAQSPPQVLSPGHFEDAQCARTSSEAA